MKNVLFLLLFLSLATQLMAQRDRPGKRKGKRVTKNEQIRHREDNSIATHLLKNICCEFISDHSFSKKTKKQYYRTAVQLALEVEQKALEIDTIQEESVDMLSSIIYSFLIHTQLDTSIAFRELNQFYILKDTTFDIFRTNIALRVSPNAKNQFYFIYTLSVFEEGSWRTKEWLVEKEYCFENPSRITLRKNDFIAQALLDRNKALRDTK